MFFANKPEIFEYAKGKTANLKPWLIVEVLSPGTRNKDWGEKLPRYKRIESLKYILLVEQDIPLVTVFARSEGETRWKGEDFDRLDQFFELAGGIIKVADIYEDVLARG